MFNTEKYYGDTPLNWNPDCRGFYPNNSRLTKTDNVFVWEKALFDTYAERLIFQFNEQPQHPVGVSGYNDDSNVGSYRANAWATDLAKIISSVFTKHLPQSFQGDGQNLVSDGMTIPCIFDTSNKTYSLLGSTPLMRFMKYNEGGKHVPHYDAPYHNEQEQYITLFSWVLYLNDLDENAGGRFQFVDDGLSHITPQSRPAGSFDDWRAMADPTQVTLSVTPKQGTLLVFPHWVCHQVEEFLGPVRYIIRGDVAYGYANNG